MYQKNTMNMRFVYVNFAGFRLGIALFVLTFLGLNQINAQVSESVQYTITVQNPLGESVANVSVTKENDENSVLGTTNPDGVVTFKADKNTKVVLKVENYISQTIELTQPMFSVVLEVQTEKVNEVVVVGYATSKRKELTGSIGSVSGATLAKQPVLTAAQALQGKLAGVQITNYGSPGSAPTVRIRGTGSVIGGAEPLYVVDGVITEDIRNINNADILSVDVLKDASSTAIYGVRASNGVILITTKAGSRGKASVTYDGYFGIKSITNKVIMAGPNLFANYSNEAADAQTVIASDISGKTDWFDAITRTGLQQNHSISVSGGGELATSLFSINYMKEEGILKGNDYERLSVRNNNTFNINKALKFGNNINLSTYHSNNKPFGLFTQAYNAAPIYNAKNADGSYGYTTKSDVGNPLASLELTDDKSFGYRLMGNVFGELVVIKGLTFRTSFGTDMFDNNGENYQSKYKVSPTQRYDTTTLTQSNNRGYRWIWDNLMTYAKSLKNQNFKLMLGHTAELYDGYMYAISRDGVPPQSQYRYLNTGSSTVQANLQYQRPIADYGRRESYLARANYSFKDKLFVTASFRRDGSSKFPEQNRWGNFPSVGFGYELSKEAFFNVPKLTYFKLRASWGKVGNDRINPSEFVTLLSSGLSAVFGNNIKNGTTIAEVKDPNLTWETTTEYDLGADYELMGGRIRGTIDYYYKYTAGALFNIPLSAGLGDNNNSMLTNAADISNSGLELSISYNNEKSKSNFKYSVGLNATFNKNRVENLGLGQPTNFGNLNNGEFATRVATGQPIGSFWVYETNGVYQNEAEVAASPHLFGAKPGDFKLVDKNGDGIINDKDREYVGSYQPICYLGMNSQMSYKNWDLSFDIISNLGNKVFNGKKTVRYGGNYNVEYEVAMNRWKPTNATNEYPRAFNGVPKPSTYFVESGSFARLNSLSIGYTLPAAWAQKSKVKAYRFYITAQNIFTWKAYSGFTAELPGSPPEAGIELNVYPTSSTILTGINIQF
jgi:TonB-linked SusC/RagA family outer membrane protein